MKCKNCGYSEESHSRGDIMNFVCKQFIPSEDNGQGCKNNKILGLGCLCPSCSNHNSSQTEKDSLISEESDKFHSPQESVKSPNLTGGSLEGDFILSDKRKDLLKRFKEVPLLDIMPLILEQDAEFIRLLKEEISWRLKAMNRGEYTPQQTSLNIRKEIDKLAYRKGHKGSLT